jgi:hypothetical protein
MRSLGLPLLCSAGIDARTSSRQLEIDVLAGVTLGLGAGPSTGQSAPSLQGCHNTFTFVWFKTLLERCYAATLHCCIAALIALTDFVEATCMLTLRDISPTSKLRSSLTA